MEKPIEELIRDMRGLLEEQRITNYYLQELIYMQEGLNPPPKSDVKNLRQEVAVGVGLNPEIMSAKVETGAEGMLIGWAWGHDISFQALAPTNYHGYPVTADLLINGSPISNYGLLPLTHDFNRTEDFTNLWHIGQVLVAGTRLSIQISNNAVAVPFNAWGRLYFWSKQRRPLEKKAVPHHPTDMLYLGGEPETTMDLNQWDADGFANDKRRTLRGGDSWR